MLGDGTLGWALIAGVAIAAAAGFRAFLPLLAIGLAGRFAGLPLVSQAEWLTSDVALVALGTATLLEIAADKIPIVDHFLDAVGTGLKPLSAAFGAYAVFVAWPEPWGLLVALVLGIGALVLQIARAQLRLGSTLVTGGLANPLLSILEDLAALLLVAAALFLPILAGILVLALLAGLRRRRQREPSGGRPA